MQVQLSHVPNTWSQFCCDSGVYRLCGSRGCAAMAAVAGAPHVSSERRKRRDRTRWGPDDGDDGEIQREAVALQSRASDGATASATPSSAEAANVQPRRPKRSRWATEELEVQATVPGLAVPVSLPASLAGLVDANPQAMILHRKLSTVSKLLPSPAPKKARSSTLCRRRDAKGIYSTGFPIPARGGFLRVQLGSAYWHALKGLSLCGCRSLRNCTSCKASAAVLTSAPRPDLPPQRQYTTTKVSARTPVLSG